MDIFSKNCLQTPKKVVKCSCQTKLNNKHKNCARCFIGGNFCVFIV